MRWSLSKFGFWTWLAPLAAFGLLVACGPGSLSQTSPSDSVPTEAALPAPITAATPQDRGPIKNTPAAPISTVAPQPESSPSAVRKPPSADLVQPKPSVQPGPPVQSAGLLLPLDAVTVEPAQKPAAVAPREIEGNPSLMPTSTMPAGSTTRPQGAANTVVREPAPESTSGAAVETRPPPSPAPAATPAPEPKTSPPAAPSAVPSSLGDNAQTESAALGESLEQAPSFTLPTVGGGTASLDSYLGKRNVVLVFYRAFW